MEIEFVDFTDRLQTTVVESSARNGLAHVSAPHATGAFILRENEKGLLEGIKHFLGNTVPKKIGYKHL
jgi:thiamine phosphate synthase YjbQ (UPF0047 family)